MTRWLVSHNWNMSMQVVPECTLATTFKADGKFFLQILRWTRNTWRSDYKSLVLERDIWYRYPIQVSAITLLNVISSWSIAADLQTWLAATMMQHAATRSSAQFSCISIISRLMTVHTRRSCV
jgi:hypothetical protein